tara:strand:+ start:1126 stop:1881 length:756 start_codon:yes stop_codon:yes gene_type:complete
MSQSNLSQAKGSSLEEDNSKLYCSYQCPICLDLKPYDQMAPSDSCEHKVCWKCYGEAHKLSASILKCPLCRKEFTKVRNQNVNNQFVDNQFVDNQFVDNQFVDNQNVNNQNVNSNLDTPNRPVRRRLDFNSVFDPSLDFIPLDLNEFDRFFTHRIVSNIPTPPEMVRRRGPSVAPPRRQRSREEIRMDRMENIRYSLRVPLNRRENSFLENCLAKKLQKIWKKYTEKKSKNISMALGYLELTEIEKRILGL